MGHPISSDKDFISQQLLLNLEFYYPMHVAMGVAYSCLKNGVFITTGSYALQFVNNTVKAHFVTYCIGNSIVSFSTIAK